jgi:hypothetical protein
MRIREGTGRILGSYPERRDHSDGPIEDKRSSRLASPQQHQRRSSLLGIHWLLPLLHPQLLEDRMTARRAHKESYPLPLATQPTKCLRDAKNLDVQEADPATT